MRYRLAWLAVFLLALTVAAPIAEAFEDCQVVCAAGSTDDCGTSACCSCCPVVRFVVSVEVPNQRLDATAEPIHALQTAPRDAEPRGILHVPKPLSL